MAKKRARYRVLRPVRSDRRGKRWDVGDFVSDDDFPPDVIDNWLAGNNPALEEAEYGSDAKRKR